VNVQVPRGITLEEFLKILKEKVKINKDKIRVWRMERKKKSCGDDETVSLLNSFLDENNNVITTPIWQLFASTINYIFVQEIHVYGKEEEGGKGKEK
jgi:hypothetical protein